MTTYGVTAAGFVPKTQEVIRAEIEAAFKLRFGDSVQLDPASDLGQLIGLFAEREASLWSLAQGVDAGFDPDRTTGSLQDSLCAITGTTREPATYSTVTALVTGTNGTALPAGKVASVVGTGVRFQTTALATLATATAWVAGVHTAGEIRSNAGNIYSCKLDVNSATVPGSDAAHWTLVGTGLAYASASFKAQDTGPLVALAGTLTTIETPFSGWNSVYNLTDAAAGTKIETDSALRLRREEELAASGNATADSIRADVLKALGVTTCTVFINNTMAVNSDGLPAKSIECLVQGGTDQAVRDAIWATVAAGIETYGSAAGSVTDAGGNTQIVKFSRPTALTIWVIINVTYDAATFPSDGATQIRDAILTAGKLYSVGLDARASAVAAKAFGIPGVLDVTSTLIGLSNPPVASTTITASARQLATWDSSRISVVATPGTP